MNCSIIKKSKIFFIIALALIVVGLTFFGIFGFNQTVDYKVSYEMQVSVDQKAGNAVQVIKDSADAYFSENAIKPVKYATQTLDDGATIVYKFSYDVTSVVSALKTSIQNELEEKSTVKGIKADVVVKEVYADDTASVASMLIALAVVIVAVFIYTLIMEKLAGAVSTIFSAVMSLVLYLAFMGITRVPAAPFVMVGAVITVALSMLVSVAFVNKYKAEYKKADKSSSLEIVEKVAFSSTKLYIYVGIAVLLTAIALCLFIKPYLMIASVHVLIAGICGLSSAIFATPFMWSLIKKNKK